MKEQFLIPEIQKICFNDNVKTAPPEEYGGGEVMGESGIGDE